MQMARSCFQCYGSFSFQFCFFTNFVFSVNVNSQLMYTPSNQQSRRFKPDDIHSIPRGSGLSNRYIAIYLRRRLYVSSRQIVNINSLTQQIIMCRFKNLASDLLKSKSYVNILRNRSQSMKGKRILWKLHSIRSLPQCIEITEKYIGWLVLNFLHNFAVPIRILILFSFLYIISIECNGFHMNSVIVVFRFLFIIYVHIKNADSISASLFLCFLFTLSRKDNLNK